MLLKSIMKISHITVTFVSVLLNMKANTINLGILLKDYCVNTICGNYVAISKCFKNNVFFKVNENWVIKLKGASVGVNECFARILIDATVLVNYYDLLQINHINATVK
ncbi:MAG: hypothetical protein RR938_06515, partial [Muribaculaceae bacterium]